MADRPEYRGYPLETLLQARPRLEMVVNDFVQVAATNKWAARSAPNVVGAWYENGQYAKDDNDTINARYRFGWGLLKGCQTYIEQNPEALHGGLQVAELGEESVQLSSNTRSTTFRVHRRYYDAFTAEGDTLLPVYSVTTEGAGGIYVIVIRNGVVMAAIHARTHPEGGLKRALANGTVPRVSPDFAAGPTVPE